MNIDEWAIRWKIPPVAITELMNMMGVDYSSPSTADQGISETAVQQRIRLDASRAGVRLWRNNNGAAYDDTGRFIRYGLANDSKEINNKIKSSDLIGIIPHVVVLADVGRTIGIFTSVEVKKPGWVFSGTKRETAQLAWIKLIISMGGHAKFAAQQEEWR